MPNLENVRLAQAQKLKDQCKDKEALETLTTIENANELTADDQIRFYLLQSSLFSILLQHPKALDAADLAYKKSKDIGNDLGMLDASLARGLALGWARKTEECSNSLLKCEELFANIQDQPENIIGKRKADLARNKALYNVWISKYDKSLEWSKIYLALSEKYGSKRDIAWAFLFIGINYNYSSGETGETKGLENYENSFKLGQELHDDLLKIRILRFKGWYYRKTGQFAKYLENSKTHLALSEKYGSKRDIAWALYIIGLGYSENGDFSKGLEHFENSMKILEELNDPVILAVITNRIGEVYRLQGDLDRALAYYNRAWTMNEEMGVKDFIPTNLENIALIYYEKGELDKALNYGKRSLQLFKEVGTNLNISAGLFYIIPIYLERNELESAQICLDELQKIKDIEENQWIDHWFLLAKVLMLKKTGGTRNIIKAENILKKLLEEKWVDNELLIIILLNLVELLYMELQITNETEILDEIPHLITRLHEIAETTQSFSLLAEIYLFKAKLELLNFQITEAQRLLTRAQQITQQYHLPRLEKKISKEHDQFLEKLDIWKELKTRNAPLAERLEIFSLEDDLNLMMRKKAIEDVEILPEVPLLLSIIAEGGVSLFTHFFSQEWENKLMFSSFMTAFNGFSHEFFAKTLDRVKIGENTIIMSPFEDKFLCYVIRGQSYPAQQKLIKFSEGIKNSKDILGAINRSFSTGAILNEENTPILGELVNTIFK